ncbi:putative protein kinase RLK-Pelle-CrRLK1L-1 family [Helianthus annuus]|nr:putative protein kinase RLK-Pelle-CrRLK1L-1 family [Helianthus annuus]KAJ0834248.1 putative protein kinase RLK-Pelle-CrRLK1L-1 family [Helianthus annuus]
MSNSKILKIPLQEISLATNNFAKENIIGKGGYGLVYQGQSEKHGLLAIKRLMLGPQGHGDHEYGTEIELLSNYKHGNVVSLIGFCGEGQERILVYKYEANGSLDKALQRKDLSWTTRLQICVDAARGLRYLHNYENGNKPLIIHRDIKSSNILLDENWNAKISDFGLSRLALTNSANSVLYTPACGTPGYVDPEYLQDCTLTHKSDVYSFGVVLFEVLFGKVVGAPDRGQFTAKMAKMYYKEKKLHQMIDSDLKNQMNSASLSTFSSIANECLQDLRKDRPTMSRVMEALEKALGYQQGGTGESLG